MHVPDSPIPAQLTVVAWPDPVIDVLGFPPHHPYSEMIWTPTLGPSATLAWRRLGGTLLHRPDGFTLDVGQFATALGLGHRGGQHSPICRTLRRLVRFDLARFVDEATLGVRRCIPPLSHSHLATLTPELRRVHAVLMDRHAAWRNNDTMATGA